MPRNQEDGRKPWARARTLVATVTMGRGTSVVGPNDMGTSRHHAQKRAENTNTSPCKTGGGVPATIHTAHRQRRIPKFRWVNVTRAAGAKAVHGRTPCTKTEHTE